jgi:hypothetical protein
LYFHIGVWLLKVSWNGCFDIYPTLFPRTNIEMWNVSETTTPSYCIYWLYFTYFTYLHSSSAFITTIGSCTVKIQIHISVLVNIGCFDVGCILHITPMCKIQPTSKHPILTNTLICICIFTVQDWLITLVNKGIMKWVFWY